MRFSVGDLVFDRMEVHSKDTCAIENDIEEVRHLTRTFQDN